MKDICGPIRTSETIEQPEASLEDRAFTIVGGVSQIRLQQLEDHLRRTFEPSGLHYPQDDLPNIPDLQRALLLRSWITNRVVTGSSPSELTQAWEEITDHPLMHLLVYCSLLEELEQLVNAGAYIEARDVRGWTPLHLAAFIGNEAAVLKLIEYGASLATWDDEGRSVLHNAAHSRNGSDSTGVVRALLHAGASVHDRDFRYQTPLHKCTGLSAVTTLLLSHGADLKCQDYHGHTPLHTAAGAGDVFIARALINEGADVNAPANDGSTPLHRVASVDLNETRISHFTSRELGNGPHMATEESLLETAKVLLDAGASANARDEQLDTPFMCAVQNRSFSVVKLLIDNGASPNVFNVDGIRPIDVAVQSHDTMVLGLLLEAGATLEPIMAVQDWSFALSLMRSSTEASLAENWSLGHPGRSVEEAEKGARELVSEV